MEGLRQDGTNILLIYDNAMSPDELTKFLPRGTGPRIIVTSNAPNWAGVAALVEIEVWPSTVGADFLISRTGRQEAERDAALSLSAALGGLPLAHEQAGAFCDRLGISLAEYLRRFEAAPGMLLDAEKDAPADYHDRLTVAKTFALAIDEAAKRHPAAESLIVYVAMLAAEPIPLYLFSDGLDRFTEPFVSSIKEDGLDEAIAVLRAFALVDRESIPDERDLTISTDCIRLHRLVRQVAAARHDAKTQTDLRWDLMRAMALAYPDQVDRDPTVWPRARRLDPIALALANEQMAFNKEAEIARSYILDQLAGYREKVLATYSGARQLYERALTISEKVLGCDHTDTAASLNNLGRILEEMSELAQARPYYERALGIIEKARGEQDETAAILNNIGGLLEAQDDRAGARKYYERALAIREKVLDPHHVNRATSLNNLGYLLLREGDLKGARPRLEGALSIIEKTLGTNTPRGASILNNLGGLLEAQGDLVGARKYYERALEIRENVLGPDHPDTAISLNNLGCLLTASDRSGAHRYLERALKIYEAKLGPSHPTTRMVAASVAIVLSRSSRFKWVRMLLEKFSLKDKEPR
jgi:Tfp pilus assembly protein PilF